METAWNPLALVGSLLTIAAQVIDRAKTAKSNRRKCDLLRERVEMISALLNELRKWQCMPPDEATRTMLRHLDNALARANDLVESCQRKKKLWHFRNAQKKAGEFADLDKRISNFLQDFHIANRILILSLSNDRFFIYALEILLGDGACRRLPKDKKDDLKKCISGLTNCDSMSQDNQRVLKLIIRDLMMGASSVNRGGGDQTDVLLNLIAQTAADIIGEAKNVNQSKEEFQWLAQIVQQVLDLMQHPQAHQLTRHTEAGKLLDRLWYDLNEAIELVRSKNVHKKFRRQQDFQIRKVGYRIEYCLQVLPVITRPRRQNS
ncbi:unnamed protein product [Urochloa humidicola]